MPNDKIDIETDENPETAYEDKSTHERTGFEVDMSKRTDDKPEQPVFRREPN
jgi:hypothetical protein